MEQATEGQSIDAQRDKIEKFLQFDTTFENVDYRIIDYCDNGFSGKNLERPAVATLLNDVNNKFDIGFISINEKIDTKTAHGRFFIGILSSLSQLEREQTSERVQSVFKELVHKQPLGGKAPFGYFYYKPGLEYYPYNKFYAEKVNLPPLKIQNVNDLIYPATYVPLMFEWYKIDNNYRQIALRLTDIGIPTPNTIHTVVKEFFKLSEEQRINIKFLWINKAKKWNPRSVKDILSNPFYTGSRIWNRKDNLNKKIRSYDEWIYIPDAHEKLIELKEFRLVEELI